eukprot:IDg23338t1
MAPKSERHEKLTKDSVAVRAIHSKFKSGDYGADADPRSVYDSDKRFYDHHNYNPFRARFSVIKKEYFPTDLDDLDTKSTIDEATNPKRRKYEELRGDGDAEIDDDDHGAGLTAL